MSKIILIVGPTGTGKTTLSIKLAKKYDAVILNADSTQVYTEPLIATAKIKEHEKENIEHYLFDVVSLNDDYTLYDYQKDGRRLLDRFISENKNVIIVGGSGLYVKALLYNYVLEDKKEINIDEDREAFISPCDCKLSVYKASDETFRIKHVNYSLDSLLKNSELAKEYKDDYVVICRLTPDNYHRYCYIDSGYHGINKKIKGVLNTVRPIAVENKKVYVTNQRSYTILDTDNFGKVIQVEVGALMVGKIKNEHKNYFFTKGEEKGFFKYGGSTIILLVKKDNVKIDNYLINNTKKGYETIINMGDKIGIKKED